MSVATVSTRVSSLILVFFHYPLIGRIEAVRVCTKVKAFFFSINLKSGRFRAVPKFFCFFFLLRF